MKSQFNPYRGRPGFWNHVQALFFPITGQAQVGIGHGVTEDLYVPPVNPPCPICSKPMAGHRLVRGDARTASYLTCPK